MRMSFFFTLLMVLWSSCSLDYSAPLSPSGKITTERVPVASDSLYCRDAVFWRSYCDRWGNDLAHGGCEAISACAEGDTFGVAAIVSDTAWVAINPSSHGWIRVPQKRQSSRFQRWIHPHYANWTVDAYYDAPAPPDSIGIVTYPFRTAKGKRTLYGFPSEPFRGVFIAAKSEQPEPPAPRPEPPAPPPEDPEPPPEPGPLRFPGEIILSDLWYAKGVPILPKEFPLAIGGFGKITYSLSGIPSGLSFDSITRILSGMPDTLGEYEVLYGAADEGGATVGLIFSISIVEPLTLGETDWGILFNLVQGVRMASITIGNPSGGVPPYAHTVTGLPPGISFNASNRRISGTPTEPGKYNVIYQVQDVTGALGVLEFESVVEPPKRLSFVDAHRVAGRIILVKNTPMGEIGFPEAIGGVGEIAYSMSNVPPGLSFDPATRNVTGTPTVAGVYENIYSATDEAGARAELSFSFVVPESLTLGPTDWTGLENLVQGTPMIPVTIINPLDGVPPYTHGVYLLPPGISFNSDALVISGTPTEAGSYYVVYEVEDAAGALGIHYIPTVVEPAP